MQERYLGDIHDFQKFIFLKFLSCAFNQKIGLNWYLVDPKKIGEKEVKKKDSQFKKKNPPPVVLYPAPWKPHITKYNPPFVCLYCVLGCC